VLEYCARFRLRRGNKSASELPWIKVPCNITIYTEVCCSLFFQSSLAQTDHQGQSHLSIHSNILLIPECAPASRTPGPDLAIWNINNRSFGVPNIGLPASNPITRARAGRTGHYSSTPILPQKDSHINNPLPGVTQSRALPAKRDLRHDPDLYILARSACRDRIFRPLRIT